MKNSAPSTASPPLLLLRALAAGLPRRFTPTLLLSCLVAMLTVLATSSRFLPPLAYVPPQVQERWKKEGYNLDMAMKEVEKCANAGEDEKELYYAVRYIDRNAHKIYDTVEKKADLWNRAVGSWELRLAYEDSRTQNFFPYPDFREFAMATIIVEDDYFGKGIAQSPFFCYTAMGGPSMFNNRTRQILMNYEDFYISGRCMPDWDLSYFMRGYARNWYDERRKRPPLAFTVIAASDNVLVVRGSKTGGMAIFRRIRRDMREAAYGDRTESGGV